jgi:hypothetical protein
MIDRADVLDGTVVRVPKTYPGYFGAYAEFPRLRAWLDGVENLFWSGATACTATTTRTTRC